MRETGGWGAAVTDTVLVAGVRLLAETTGVFTETAGGVTVAGAVALSRGGRLRPEDEVVLCITGNGLKTLEEFEGALPESPVIDARLREVTALVEAA
jgi:threonine synthase